MQITLSLDDFINKTSELMQQAYKYKDKRGLFLNDTDWNNLSLMLLEFKVGEKTTWKRYRLNILIKR